MTKKAFTLIELLIVIAIIGILATIIMVSYSNMQSKARDSKRIADLNAISGAVKMYQVDHKKYPKVLNNIEDNDCYSRVRSTNDPHWESRLATMLEPYISMPLAQDPRNSVYTAMSNQPIWLDPEDRYYYTYSATDVSFVLAARVENVSNSNQDKLGSKKNIKPGTTPPGVTYDTCTSSAAGLLKNADFSSVHVAATSGHYIYYIGENLYQNP